MIKQELGVEKESHIESIMPGEILENLAVPLDAGDVESVQPMDMRGFYIDALDADGNDVEGKKKAQQLHVASVIGPQGETDLEVFAMADGHVLVKKNDFQKNEERTTEFQDKIGTDIVAAYNDAIAHGGLTEEVKAVIKKLTLQAAETTSLPNIPYPPLHSLARD